MSPLPSPAPPSTDPDPNLYGGVYPAKVYSTADPNGTHRIQMYIPQVFGALPVKIWAPPCIPQGVVPAVGDIVWCLFQGGDPAYPTYLPKTAGTGGGTFSGFIQVVAGPGVVCPFADFTSDGTGHDEVILNEALAAGGNGATLVLYGNLQTSGDWDTTAVLSAGWGFSILGGAPSLFGQASSIYVPGIIKVPSNCFITIEDTQVNIGTGALFTAATGAVFLSAAKSGLFCGAGLVDAAGWLATIRDCDIYTGSGTWSTPPIQDLTVQGGTWQSNLTINAGSGGFNNAIKLSNIDFSEPNTAGLANILIKDIDNTSTKAFIHGCLANVITLDASCIGAGIKCVNNAATVVDNSIGGAHLGGNY